MKSYKFAKIRQEFYCEKCDYKCSKKVILKNILQKT